jgi:FlaA1/EpsC-like NDP-sugar epimerase
VGIRPGEKLHEVLLSEDEARNSVEAEDMFVIQPAQSWWPKENWRNDQPLAEGFRYASDTNTKWLTAENLYELVEGSAPTLCLGPRESRLHANA